MIKTTTPNDILLQLYHETDETSQKDFQLECLLNGHLAEEVDSLNEIKNSLDALSIKPKASSIEAIMRYSASFMVRG
jgi:hypothetical protein